MTPDEELLRVRLWGEDDGVDDVSECLLRVLEKARDHGCSGILVDERDRDYRLGTVDLIAVAERCCHEGSWTRRTAHVCHPRHLHDASFWETVAVNRGLNVRVFTSLQEGLAWVGRKKRGSVVPAA